MSINNILKLVFVMIAVSMQFSAVSADNLAASNDNGTSLATATGAFGSYNNLVQSIILSIILTVFAGLIIYLLIKLWKQRGRILKDDGILVYPFETANSDDKYNGKAIPIILIAELKRIDYILRSEIYKQKFAWYGLPINGKIKVTEEQDPTPQIGTIGVGASSISIGELMIAIKKLHQGGDLRKKIKGSLEKSGSNIKLIAFISGDEGGSWEIQRKSNTKPKNEGKDEFFDIKPESYKDDNNSIFDLARDLAYEIFYHMKGKDIDFTMAGFKNSTEAVSAYSMYDQTKDIFYLQLAEEKCLDADRVEPKNPKIIFFLYNLGDTYCEDGKYNESKNLLEKFLEKAENSMDEHLIKYPFGYNSLGKAYMGLGSDEDYKKP